MPVGTKTISLSSAPPPHEHFFTNFSVSHWPRYDLEAAEQDPWETPLGRYKEQPSSLEALAGSARPGILPPDEALHFFSPDTSQRSFHSILDLQVALKTLLTFLSFKLTLFQVANIMAFTLLQLSAALLAFFYSPVLVNAESHTVRFNNKCGHGTPMLIRGPDVLSKGPDYTSNGPLSSAIAYLQTGNCGFNGENCAIVEFTLNNPTCAGCGSSTDISLISPHGFNVETGFSYFGGCDGSGATCNSGSCSSAFFKPDDNQVQVACQDNNVNLEITFCGSGSSNNDEAPASPEHSSSKAPAPASSSVKVAPVKATPPPVQFTTTIHAIPTSKAPVSQPSPVVSSSAEDSTATPASPSAQSSSVPPRCRPGSSRRRRSLEQIENVNETRTVPRRHHRRLSRQHISPVAITA